MRLFTSRHWPHAAPSSSSSPSSRGALKLPDFGAQRCCSSRIERTLANITSGTRRGTCDARGAAPSRSPTTSAARTRYRRLGRRVSRSSSYVEQTNKSFEPRRARPLDAGAVGCSTSRRATRAEEYRATIGQSASSLPRRDATRLVQLR